MQNLLESDLRLWLKNVWLRGKRGVGLSWIEPAKGSSVGFPDVLIPVWPTLIPVELKVTKKHNEGYSCIVRPVQRRFHSMMKGMNFVSFYLLAVGERDCFDVWLAHNSFFPWETNKTPGDVLIASSQNRKGSVDQMHIVGALLRLMNEKDQVIIQIPGDLSMRESK